MSPGGAVRMVAIALVVFALGSAAPKKPVFVGSRVCGACHNGPGMGHQYSRWLLSKHAMAYAALSKPESRKIAQISGLREEPWKAPVCLGCHSTGATAEPWEKDEGFHAEEGLQCEGCHGPGSEYSSEEVMKNRAEAVKNGLRLPTEETCIGCHIEKGSHVAVLTNPTVDIKKAIKEVAHPLPKPASSGGLPPERIGYIGSEACGTCHRGAEHGHQYDRWRSSPHARAWAILSTPRAFEVAKQQGVSGDPQLSPKCLECHSVSKYADEGVGCEACHAPGAKYASEPVMRDKTAARAAGLRTPSKDDCKKCHRGSASKPFDVETAWKTIAHPTKLPQVAAAPKYKTPLNLKLRPGTGELWVACEGADGVQVIDTRTRKVLAEIHTGGAATDVAFAPGGKRAYVSNREEDSVTVIDAAARTALATLKTGDEPHGLLTDKPGKLLYVLNTSSDDITVFDITTLRRVKTLSAGRGPWSLALSPDGSTLAATNMYSHMTGYRKPLSSEATFIATGGGTVIERTSIPDANLMMGIAWHPSGRYALATMNRTKSLVPMTRLMQGWTITNGLAVLWKDGTVDQVLLDEPGLGFADATDVAFTPDGRYALVTSSGTDRVAVVDCLALTRVITTSTKADREQVLPNHLGKSALFVTKSIPVGRSPRGIEVDPSGEYAWVADSLDDTLTVIDLRRMAAAGKVDLGGPKEITPRRRGERLFHSANVSFRKQFACHSCHPDGHVDAVTYDIEADGIGVSPVDNRTLRGILDTAPFKWEGTNPTISFQCGPRLSVFFTRVHPFTKDQLADLDLYITTIPRPPNRYRAQGAPLTPAQRRGKVLFERTNTFDGRAIPAENQCLTCHFPPNYTNRKVFDVGTRQAIDRTGRFDVPHLNNIYDSAPYLHNGMARTLEEIWTVYNPYDKHGVTNDMTKDQLNDLIEYLKTL